MTYRWLLKRCNFFVLHPQNHGETSYRVYRQSPLSPEVVFFYDLIWESCWGRVIVEMMLCLHSLAKWRQITETKSIIFWHAKILKLHWISRFSFCIHQTKTKENTLKLVGKISWLMGRVQWMLPCLDHCFPTLLTKQKKWQVNCIYSGNCPGKICD